MSLFDRLREPLSMIPDLFKREKPRTIADTLEGATISRLRYLADLGMYGGTQCLLELRDHRIAIVMSAPAPRDVLGRSLGEYAWTLAVQMMEKRLIVTKSIETQMREDRVTMGEEPGDQVQRRVEGQTILRVPDSKHPIPPWASKGIKLELSNGCDFYLIAMPPSKPPRQIGDIQAELFLDVREGDRLISVPGR